MTQTLIPGTGEAPAAAPVIKCCVCSHRITDSASVETEMGPVCRSRQHLVETLSRPGAQVSIPSFPHLKGGTKHARENIPFFVAGSGKRVFGVPLIAYRTQPIWGWGRKATDEERYNLALCILLNWLPAKYAAQFAREFEVTFLFHMAQEMGLLTYKIVRDWALDKAGPYLAEEKDAAALEREAKKEARATARRAQEEKKAARLAAKADPSLNSRASSCDKATVESPVTSTQENPDENSAHG